MDKDENIIRLIAEGDQQAFKKLYDQFSSMVFNTALSYAQDNNDAEEITQDVFVSIFRNAGKFRAESSLTTWIYRITVNTSLNFIKRRKRHSFINVEIKKLDRQDFDHPGVLLENKENARILFQLIDTLADNQKTAFILSYVELLPQKEVAEIMGTSLKAVESLLQRGKKKLREKLKKNDS
ncbi:MAG: RNA polymerase sigma factor [Bacteroidota bacterium]